MPTNVELNARLKQLIKVWNMFACGEGQPVPYEQPDPEPTKEEK